MGVMTTEVKNGLLLDIFRSLQLMIAAYGEVFEYKIIWELLKRRCRDNKREELFLSTENQLALLHFVSVLASKMEAKLRTDLFCWHTFSFLFSSWASCIVNMAYEIWRSVWWRR